MSRRPPIRVTGFTRFFIVMLFVAPLAYIGASYYNGEDGIANIKQLLKLDNSKPASIQPNTDAPATESDPPSRKEDASSQVLLEENKKMKEELEFKNKRIGELYLENEELKRKLESAEKALDETK